MSEGDAVTTPGVRDSDPLTSTEPGIPLYMNVTLTIKPERLGEYLAALREVLPAARAEPNCIYLHVGQSITEPGVFVLSEAWKDRVEYRDTILPKPYYQAYLQISESTYAQPRRTVLLAPVELANSPAQAIAPRLHVVVGYDGTPPASRALDAAVRLLRGREGSIEVSYVAHVPGLDMLSADAIVEARAAFDEVEKELRGSAAARLDGRGVAWEFRRRDGLIADELIAAATASRDTHPGDTQMILVGSSFHLSHRVIGSIAVGLARHCPVPLVIVP